MRHSPLPAAPWLPARSACVSRKPHRWTSGLPDTLHRGMPPTSPFEWRQTCHTHDLSPIANASHACALAAPRPFATLPLRATRRLLQSGRCFAAHDICCFMRHGCRFHCAERGTVVRLLSGLRQAIRTTVPVRRRVNSPRSVSPSGSSTRSALHDFFCPQARPEGQHIVHSMHRSPPKSGRQHLHTHPTPTLPGDAA